MHTKVAFLDRDGTLGVDNGYIFKSSQWVFINGAIDSLNLLKNAGFAIAVVTNQSGVAAGLYTEHDVRDLHLHIQREVNKLGARIDAFAFCPHGSKEGCSCRKPQTDMASHVANQIGKTIDYEQSWTIGDKISDMGFGASLGTQIALIRSRYWNPSDLMHVPDLIVQSLREAAFYISARSTK